MIPEHSRWQILRLAAVKIAEAMNAAVPGNYLRLRFRFRNSA
jgi:hypothetical protein